MIYNDFMYVGAKPTTATKTLIKNISEIPSSFDHPFYISAYRFDASVVDLESLADLPTDTKIYTDYLTIDLDGETNSSGSADLEQALKDCRTLANRLDEIDAGYEVWFSGGKGFHVLIPTCQFGFKPTSDEQILKRMAVKLCSVEDKFPFKTFDNSIYNKTRVIRAKNSKHENGRFKIPIDNVNNYTMNTIIAMASENIEPKFPSHDDFFLNGDLEALYKECLIPIVRTREQSISHFNGSLFNPSEKGGRNNEMYAFARKLAIRSVPLNDAIEFCSAYNFKYNVPPLDSKEVDITVNSAYKKGMNDLEDVQSTSNIVYSSNKSQLLTRESFINARENTFYTGYEAVDDFTMGIRNGELTTILAASGNFKSMILSNIVKRGSLIRNQVAIIFSMEMSHEQLTARHIQESERLDQLSLIDAIESGVVFSKFDKEYKNVMIVDRSNLSVDDMLTICDYVSERHGKIGAIGVDYLTLMKGCAGDNKSSTQAMSDLKTRLARKVNCPVFCLLQAKMEYGEGNVEMKRTGAEWTKNAFVNSDQMFGVWHHIDDSFNKTFWMRSLKARRFNSAKFVENQLWKLDIEPQYMSLKNILIPDSVPSFKQAVERF